MRPNQTLRLIDPGKRDQPPGRLTRGIVSILFGFTVGWLCAASVVGMPPVFSHTADLNHPIMAAALATLAVGIRLPHGIATTIASVLWGKTRRRPDTADFANSSDNRHLLWLAIATASMPAGLGVACLPVFFDLGRRLYDFAHDSFFWIAPAETVLTFLIAGLIIMVPFVLCGMALAALNLLAQLHQPRSQLITAPMLLAAAGGTATVHSLAVHGVQHELITLIGSVPLFVIAIIAVQRSTARPAEVDPTGGDPIISPPESASDGEMPVRVMATLCTAAGSAVFVILWTLLETAGGIPAAVVLPGLLAAAALGSWAGARLLIIGERRQFALAVICAAAGLLTIAIAVSFGALHEAGNPIPAKAMFAWSLISISLIAAAVTTNQHVVVTRAARPQVTAVAVAAQCLWMPALTLLAVALFTPLASWHHTALVAAGLTISAAAAVAFATAPITGLLRRLTPAVMVIAIAIAAIRFIPSIIT